MRRTSLLLLLVPLVLSACQDQRLVEPDQPNRQIFDGTNAGNSHFFFLPPIGKQASFSGTANTKLQPVVEICSNFSGDQCGTLLQRFSGAEVQSAGADYKVNWRTENSEPGTTYRIFVRIGSLALGWADVAIGANRNEAKSLSTEGTIGLVDGQTLPIAFRIEYGAIEEAQADPDLTGSCGCAEKTIDNGGGSVVTDDRRAGAQLPQGWLDAYPGISQVVVVIESRDLVGGKCLSASVANFFFEQAGDCAEFSTSPLLPQGFSGKQARVEVCLDSNESGEQFDLYKYSSFGPEQGINKLAPAPNDLVDCDGGGVIASLPGSWGRIAAGAWRSVVNPAIRFVAPTPLYAGDTGAGGLAGSFSTVFWGKTQYLVAYNTDFEAMPGETVPVRVLVTTGHDDEVHERVEGVPITFEVVSGGGGLIDPNGRTVKRLTVVTGYSPGAEAPSADVQWKLGATAPQQTLRATAPWGETKLFTAGEYYGEGG